MKFIFPLFAIIISGAAAYFTLSQSEKFETVQAARQEAIKTNLQVSANADVADKNITDEEALLKTSKDNLEVATQSVLALSSTGSALKNEAGKLDTELANQATEFEQLNEALEEVNKIFEDLEGDVDLNNLGDTVAEIEEDIKVKKTKVEELETLITGAKANLASQEDSVKRLIDRKASRNKRIARNAMEARITAVNQDWGFLVIGAGSNSGFTPQTKLLVKRAGRMIGYVTPSAIEPTQTIAEIDFDTLAPGVRIQPGDSVILAKPAGN